MELQDTKVDESIITDHAVLSRVAVSAEILAGIISITKDTMEKCFKKPTSYYDAEKKNVLIFAKTLFEYCVTPADIDRIAKATFLPKIIDEFTPSNDEPSSGITGTTDSECISGKEVSF